MCFFSLWTATAAAGDGDGDDDDDDDDEDEDTKITVLMMHENDLKQVELSIPAMYYACSIPERYAWFFNKCIGLTVSDEWMDSIDPG